MRSPAEVKLEHLRRVGFHVDPVLDEAGQLAFAYYTRTWRGWREVVIVHNEQEAHAYRYRPSADTADPLTIDLEAGDCFIPPGDVVKVANALLSLSEPPVDDGGSV
ncbi:MAG: hypothetical protein ACRDQ0_09485 [Pseudonocardia sp.]